MPSKTSSTWSTTFWQIAAQHAPLGSALDGDHDLAAHVSRGVNGLIQKPRVQLVRGRCLARADSAAFVTGYLLPDDQLGFWAVTVGTNMASDSNARF